MRTAFPAPRSGAVRRRRPLRTVFLAFVAIVAITFISTYFTAPRPGGLLDPESTGASGAHALVSLLRDAGVDVVVAKTVADAERAARPGTLLLVAHTQRLPDNSLLDRLAHTPGDLLLVDPTARARRALTPALRAGPAEQFDIEPNCPLPQAIRAGTVKFGPSHAYRTKDDVDAVSCYGGALVRYHDPADPADPANPTGRSITVVGSNHFMTNDGLLDQGNAALAMNLAGARARLVWFAPQRIEGRNSASESILDLIPENVTWILWQLCLVVALVAVWKARRLGPLVAEELPVVVRASETVEGRGRLYRSRRARDRAAEALRTATLQRLAPRLGLGPDTAPATVTMTVAQRCGAPAEFIRDQLYGPPPTDDTELHRLALALDDIERQVARS